MNLYKLILKNCPDIIILVSVDYYIMVT